MITKVECTQLLGSLVALMFLGACDTDSHASSSDQLEHQQVNVTSASSGPRQDLRQAGFFMDGQKNPTLLEAVRAGMVNEITFNRHFSSAFVSCGTGCDSTWFVDRRTGGVVLAPESSVEDEMTWDVVAKPDSDTIKVTFGPRDNVGAKCSAQQFLWDGKAFVALDERNPVTCPS